MGSKIECEVRGERASAESVWRARWRRSRGEGASRGENKVRAAFQSKGRGVGAMMQSHIPRCHTKLREA